MPATRIPDVFFYDIGDAGRGGYDVLVGDCRMTKKGRPLQGDGLFGIRSGAGGNPAYPWKLVTSK
jgi:hypothetical protein